MGKVGEGCKEELLKDGSFVNLNFNQVYFYIGDGYIHGVCFTRSDL